MDADETLASSLLRVSTECACSLLTKAGHSRKFVDALNNVYLFVPDAPACARCTSANASVCARCTCLCQMHLSVPDARQPMHLFVPDAWTGVFWHKHCSLSGAQNARKSCEAFRVAHLSPKRALINARRHHKRGYTLGAQRRWVSVSFSSHIGSTKMEPPWQKLEPHRRKVNVLFFSHTGSTRKVGQ
eukprot:1148588-Pelagomonas_calceolata.AAC.2